MVEKLNRETIAAQATLHAEAPVARKPHIVERTFELPPALYGATVACYLGFLAITGLAFATPGLILPMALFAFIIVAGFALPTIWTRMAPDAPMKAKSWAKFQRDGITTLTGHNSAGGATVQVLILPVLIVVWGLAVVTIAAVVR
ncbi:hypothetical protein [Alteraurantiacibacter aquimixticola]|uniref:Uncharacterized protein n=1 Tax=Alteraurantiacibacter aquimixticola TaxID=2489173 RepID=A0A4T3F0J9_9SPHN|nr:hypothetical protein [Alteraurantiacibacter aquimixticola]TIX50559.1 hypothetical protein E5222_09845 [Alteraurantiacibacter aquimixticola]